MSEPSLLKRLAGSSFHSSLGESDVREDSHEVFNQAWNDPKHDQERAIKKYQTDHGFSDQNKAAQSYGKQFFQKIKREKPHYKKGDRKVEKKELFGPGAPSS
ncbi:MAG: hypothetical protein Q9162_005753 [Coniocarpon cinnabarinum]